MASLHESGLKAESGPPVKNPKISQRSAVGRIRRAAIRLKLRKIGILTMIHNSS